MSGLSSWFSKPHTICRIMLLFIHLLLWAKHCPSLTKELSVWQQCLLPAKKERKSKTYWSFLYLNDKRSEYKLYCIILPTLVRDRCARTKTSVIAQGQPPHTHTHTDIYSTILFWKQKIKREKEDIWSSETQPKAQAYLPGGNASSQSLRVTGQAMNSDH